MLSNITDRLKGLDPKQVVDAAIAKARDMDMPELADIRADVADRLGAAGGAIANSLSGDGNAQVYALITFKEGSKSFEGPFPSLEDAQLAVEVEKTLDESRIRKVVYAQTIATEHNDDEDTGTDD